MKEIKGYEDRYSVTKEGKVFSHLTNKYIAAQTHKLGYKQIRLRGADKTRKTHLIHQLVAKTFIDNKNGYSEVNHINGDKTDNIVENLEWCSRSENMKHAFRNNLHSLVGSKNTQSKLTENDIEEIKKLLNERVYQREIAKMYGVTQQTISKVKRGNTWTHV